MIARYALTLVIAAAPVGVVAPDRPVEPVRGAIDASQQSPLEEASTLFVQAWSARDMAGVAAAMAPRGIRLYVGRDEFELLGTRQARAALDAYLEGLAVGALDVERVSDLGGSPRRGSLRLRWQTSARGTSESLVFTIFVGYERGEAAWRITEIRIM